MNHIKKFNEQDEFDNTEVRVKHLIEYLSELDPEMPVHLDHDGWESYGISTDPLDNNSLEIIKNRGLFNVFTHNGKSQLIINN